MTGSHWWLRPPLHSSSDGSAVAWLPLARSAAADTAPQLRPLTCTSEIQEALKSGQSSDGAGARLFMGCVCPANRNTPHFALQVSVCLSQGLECVRVRVHSVTETAQNPNSDELQGPPSPKGLGDGFGSIVHFTVSVGRTRSWAGSRSQRQELLLPVLEVTSSHQTGTVQ